MRIKNSQFGEIEFDDEMILTFPSGIIGFEELKKFIIVEDEECKPFRWLISIEEPEIGFAILEPTFVIENYYQKVGFDPKTFAIFSIVTLNRDISKITVNLKAPIVIDKSKKLGKQMIFDDPELEITHQLFT
jgi:flagellar assembly factor FliW